ncbi:MAG TPA: CAAX prenyl protease-related protein [Bryobacteraceae bacterium]
MEDTPPGPRELRRWPWLGYVLPFAIFIAFLTIDKLVVPVPQPVRFLGILALLAVVSRGLLPARPSRFFSSVLLGIGVFFIWVGPDALIPGYRNFILFSNSIVGHAQGITSPAEKLSIWFLVFRILSSVVTVPIIEELFWRGWMMRWIADHKFWRIPVGTYHAEAFWIVALLFASEHGSYWDVGLITGIIYNWWAIRTRNLTDCVIAHAVTNGCLAAYVILGNHWQYWL